MELNLRRRAPFGGFSHRTKTKEKQTKIQNVNGLDESLKLQNCEI